VLFRSRQRWTAGETVSLRLWVPVPGRKRGEEVVGEAWLYLRRSGDAAAARETYVRGRIIVPERRLMQGKEALGLMVVRDGPLSQFLGDAEQPSHTRWIMAKLKGLYAAPEFAFRRARHALADFERIVVGSREGEPIKDLLKPFFSRPAERAAPQDDGAGPPVIEAPRATKAVLDVRAVRGGFVAVRPPESGRAGRIRVEIRYNVRKGRPKFRKEDFNFNAGIAVECEGSHIAVTKDSASGTLLVDGAEPSFRMKVTGFDVNRDLFVRAEEEELVDGA